jgi:hypothetical protein
MIQHFGYGSTGKMQVICNILNGYFFAHKNSFGNKNCYKIMVADNVKKSKNFVNHYCAFVKYYVKEEETTWKVQRCVKQENLKK